VLARGAVAIDAEQPKRTKYFPLAARRHFIPVAIETLGSLGDEAMQCIRDVGRRVAAATWKRGRCSSCYSVSVLPYSATMLPVSLVLFVRIVPGMIIFICRPIDTESAVLWLLADLLITLLFI
jgi:hypothetical protein